MFIFWILIGIGIGSVYTFLAYVTDCHRLGYVPRNEYLRVLAELKTLKKEIRYGIGE